MKDRKHLIDGSAVRTREASLFTAVDRLAGEKTRIVFQGVPGAFSHGALLKFFGRDADCFPVAAFGDVMKAVTDRQADYGVLPIENSTAGKVGTVYDLLYKSSNTIVGEVYLPVTHCLLGLPGAREEDIVSVASHPQALAQCTSYLESHPGMQTVCVANTAVAAKKVSEDGDPAHAAIASRISAEIYGLEVLREGINDTEHNTTRFIVVSSRKIYLKDARKVSIMLELPHRSGALFDILLHMAVNGLNMTAIASMPIPERPFEYRFFIDFEGNLSEEAVISAMHAMREDALAFRILGCY